MKCKNCGSIIPDNSKFCNNCGQTIQTYQVNKAKPPIQRVSANQSFTNKSPSYQYTSNNDNSNKESNRKNKPINKKKRNIVIAVIVFFLIGGIGSALSEDSEPTTTSENSSTKYSTTTTVLSAEEKASIEASEFEEEHGVPEKLFNTISAACKEIGITGVDYLEKENDWANGERFSLSYEGFEFVVYLNRDRTINSINSGTTKYFENGKAVRNANDHIYTIDQKIQIKIWAEDAVSAKLKAPSTATFANSGEWSYSRDKDIFTAVAYVDAQNGFGMMTRSNFAVRIKWDGESSQATVLSVDIEN